MRNKKYTVYSLLVAGLIICVASENIFAGGTEMPGNWGSGSVDGGSGSGGGAHATKWMKHYRAKNNGTMYTSSERMPIVPQYRGTLDHDGYYDGNPVYYPEPTEPPYISAECHNSKSSADGVWILGNVTSGKTSFNNYLYYTYDTIGGNQNLNDIWSAFATPIPVQGAARSHQTAYLDENGHYGIYRTGSSGEMQYNTISSQNIALDNISWGGTSSVSTMYYGTKSGDNYIDTPAYTTTSASIAGSVEDIVNEYINYMINSGKYSEADVKTAKEYSDYGEAYNKLIQSKGIYAFCSYPEATDTSLQANVSLTVDGTPIESGWDASNVSTSITVHSSPISASTNFDFKRGVETPNMTFNASIVRLNEESYDARLTMASTELNNKEHEEKNISLSVGKNLVCSSVKHPEKISGGDNSSRSKNKEAKACVTVVYEPSVAEIDSETTISVDGHGSKKSGVDAAGTLSVGEVNYGAGAIKANWQYGLSSPKRCFEGDFKNGACGSNNTSIADSFAVPYIRNGNIYTDSSNQSITLSKPGYSASPESNSRNYNLLPGETIKETQGISHKSGVHTDGATAKNAKDESSSMTLEATAKDAICSLNNQSFGLGNPVNYGRLTVIKNTTRVYKYGNNLDGENPTWSDAGVIWLKPSDKVQLSYEACIGEQIKKDKNSGKKWTDTITEDGNNTLLVVGTTGSLLNNSHYKDTGNAVAMGTGSAQGRNITSFEVIGNTISGHVSNNYQFVGSKAVYSNENEVGNLGKTINNDFGNLEANNGTGSYLSGCGSGNCFARATMKIPYNYILEPKISAGSKEIVTLGNANTFTISVKNNDVRTNKKVQDNAYHTDIKPDTKATYLKFVAKTDTSASVLKSLEGKFISGDKTGDIASTLSGIDFKNSSGGNITLSSSGEVSEEKVEVHADEADNEYNKLCVAAAVYPADSHNLEGKSDIEDDDDQSAALSDSIDGGYTRIAVSCKTVGKYPTVSVEGNGIVAGGKVTGAYTEYNNRNFGSWTEYNLTANNVKNFASGASIAYKNAQTAINAGAAPDQSGLDTSQFDSLQTLGNISSDVGLIDNAQTARYASQAQSFAEDVKATLFNDASDDATTLKKANNITYVNTNFDGDVIIDKSLADEINSKSEQVVIYTLLQNIKISNKKSQS